MSFQPSNAQLSRQSNVRQLRPAQQKSAPAGQRREKGPTPDFLFTEAMLAGDVDYRLGPVMDEYSEPDLNIYQWMDLPSGSRWQVLKEKHIRGQVQNWLRVNLPTNLSHGCTSSCLSTWRDLMVYQRRTVPEFKENYDVVPLRNAYLLIDGQGVIRAVKPDPSFGQTYNIQADLDWSRVNKEGVYTPLEPQEGTLWYRYINATFPDKAVHDVAQEAFSMALLSRSYEKAVLMYGTGGNGKSVMLHILRNLTPAAFAAVNLKRLAKNEFGITPLVGKKVALVSETPRVLTSDIQDILKALISRDPMPVEPKGVDAYNFIPTASWFLSLNHHMTLPEHEHGWWRKNVTIPFIHRVDKDERIIGLNELITDSPAEMIQVIDWFLIGGARLTVRGRFLEDDELPTAITSLTHTQRVSSDPVAAWIEDAEPTFNKLVLTSKMDIYNHFREHVIANGKQPISSIAFWLRMAEYFRKDNLETKGVQRTIGGRERDRYVHLMVPGIEPGEVRLSLAFTPNKMGRHLEAQADG